MAIPSGFRRKLIVSTCAAATSAFLPALAHAETSSTSAAASAVLAQSAAPAGHDGEPIIITAERRTVDVQRIPLAVTAVSAKALDQSFINTLSGLNGVVPSLEITKASGFENLVTIRGVGSETPENSLTTVPGVSEFIDGVYIANTISIDQTLFDIDQIEVLRGPQGALYGQSSIGGAIIINTKQPRLHTFDASGDFSAGDYSLFRERAEVNLPLGDDFAARLSFQKYDHNGFTRDAAIPGLTLDAAHDVSGKAALLWQPNSTFSATLTGQWYYSNQAGDAQKNINDPSPDPRVLNQDYPGHFSLSTQLYHLNLQWDLPWFTIKSVTGYQILKHVQQEDGDRSTFALLHGMDPNLGYDVVAAWNTSVNNFTQEFDLLSLPGSKLQWTAGVFVLNQTSHQFVAEFHGTTPPTVQDLTVLPDIETNPPANIAYGNDSNAVHQSYSAFVQATYNFTPRFRVTAGGRINADYNRDPSFNYSTCSFGPCHSNNSTWNVVPTWRFEADYDVTPNNMVYASVARGYKPGGANGSNGQIVILPTFLPETNDAFEIGSKNFFFDHTLRLNVSAFYYLHHNFQYIEVDPFPFDSGISNIPEVHDYGVEFEAAYISPDSRFHANGSLSLEKGEVVGVYKTIDSTVANSLEGPDSTGDNSLPFFGPCAFGGAFYNPACWAAVENAAVNIQGKSPPAMPNVSGSFSMSYRFDVPGGSFTPRVEVIYRGSEWARIFNDPALDKVPSYTVTNLNFEYAPAGSKLRLDLAVTNLFNVAGINSRYTDPFGTGQTSNQYIPPRQIIGSVAYSF